MRKKLLVLPILLFGYLQANEMVYSNVVKSLYSSKDDKAVVGRLLPTVPVKILEKDNNILKIEIQGYAQDGKEQAIYFGEGKRILNAAFKKNAKVKREILEDKEWDKVSVIAYVEDGNFETDVKPMMDKAAKLYTQNCSMCHGLHNINEYNANQWPSVLKSMLSRTAIEKEDKFLVMQYLQKTTTKE